jgi:NAD(P)-dependent dehydrogenase (short-subunit alcohol dehydrogenase family)
MQLVLADVEAAALTSVELELREGGAPILGILTDVSDPNELARLAERTLREYGAVHLLVNSAGVGLVGPTTWESTLADWDWILGVNLRGIINALTVFVPIMIEQATECHIVNMGSAAGLFSPPGTGAYNASKAAVVALSTTLQQELALRGAPIKVSVLCPGLVKTRMLDAARNRPAALRNEVWIETERRRKYSEEEEKLRHALDAAMSPEEVAAQTMEAIRDERFFVFTHAWVKQELELRTRNILLGRAPWKDSHYKEPPT